MHVFWFEQTVANMPSGHAWLSADEANRLRAIRFPKRGADWLLGRWTAKNAVAAFLGLSPELQVLRDIEIRPAQSGAPEAFFRNQHTAVSISLSHRAGVAACALAPSPVLLGCDLEVVEPHSNAFVTDYFTAEEQALVAGAEATDRSRLLTLFWSGKESALKALREGLRVDTRRVVVSFPRRSCIQSENQQNSALRACGCARTSSHQSGWSPLQVGYTNGQVFHGWWSRTGDLLRTVMAAPPPDPPILLAQECLLSR